MPRRAPARSRSCGETRGDPDSSLGAHLASAPDGSIWVADGDNHRFQIFAPDDAFYVADPGNHRIQKFGPDRRFLTAWGSEGRAAGQFGTPIDLVVDGQGRVYVADSSRNSVPEIGAVQVFDADGRFLAAWGEYGTDPGEFTGPLGVAVGGDGTVYVTDMGRRLQAFRVGALPAPAATPSV